MIKAIAIGIPFDLKKLVAGIYVNLPFIGNNTKAYVNIRNKRIKAVKYETAIGLTYTLKL